MSGKRDNTREHLLPRDALRFMFPSRQDLWDGSSDFVWRLMTALEAAGLMRRTGGWPPGGSHPYLKPTKGRTWAQVRRRGYQIVQAECVVAALGKD